MRMQVLGSLIALFTLIVGPVDAQSTEEVVAEPLSASEAAAVDEAIEAAMKEDQVLGLALGVIRNREIVYLKGYGFADHQRRRPVTEDTMFRWASCSKPLAAVAAMQLVESGQLDLDADVRKYVPEYPAKAAPITARQLLCHQSGIPHYSNGKIIPTTRRYPVANPFDDPVRSIDKFSKSPLLFRPGTKESYSTYAYILLSAVTQRAGEQPFPDQIRERICAKCNAASLQPDFATATIPNRVDGLKKLGERIVPSGEVDVGWKHGGGGYISNVEDFARFARGLIRREFVSEQTEAAMWTLQPAGDGSPTRYGLGFIVEQQGGVLKVSHEGRQDETRTRFVAYPTRGDGMVVMCNCEWVEPGKYSTLAYQALSRANP